MKVFARYVFTGIDGLGGIFVTEADKLDAGLEYDFTEPEVRGRKFRAVKGCQKLNGKMMFLHDVDMNTL